MIPVSESPDSQFLLLCGDAFASGQHRVVHDVIGHPDLVMKIEKNSTFANWNEYLVSNALEGRIEPVAAIMGKVVAISASGKYLLMERLSDIERSLVGIQYPMWLNDNFKTSAYGMDASRIVKVRDYGTLKLANILASLVIAPELEPNLKIVPSGEDDGYKGLLGNVIKVDAGRKVHEVIGYPNKVIKVCNDSHKANRIELLIYSSLLDMNAEELAMFPLLECSRSGKYLLMERLEDLPINFDGLRPQFPWWIIDQSDSVLGISSEGFVKIRSFNNIRFGDILTRSPLRVFS